MKYTWYLFLTVSFQNIFEDYGWIQKKGHPVLLFIQGAEHEHFLIQFWDHFGEKIPGVFWLVIALVITGGNKMI